MKTKISLLIIGVVVGFSIGKHTQIGNGFYVYCVVLFVLMISEKFNEFVFFCLYSALFIFVPMSWVLKPINGFDLTHVFYPLLLIMLILKLDNIKSPIFVDYGDITKFPVKTLDYERDFD